MCGPSEAAAAAFLLAGGGGYSGVFVASDRLELWPISACQRLLDFCGSGEISSAPRHQQASPQYLTVLWAHLLMPPGLGERGGGYSFGICFSFGGTLKLPQKLSFKPGFKKNSKCMFGLMKTQRFSHAGC